MDQAVSIVGTIGFSGKKKGGDITSILIKFFTHSRWSHSFVGTLPFAGEESIEEAGLSVHVIPVTRYREDTSTAYEIYSVAADPEKIKASLMSCYNDYAGYKYGFLQLVWFIWRWLNEKIHRDITEEHNWFTDGVICSELVYYFLHELGWPYPFVLRDFNPDTVQPQDIYEIVQKNPQLFTLLEKG